VEVGSPHIDEALQAWIEVRVVIENVTPSIAEFRHF
jgi:hypothetical protein